MNGLERKTVLGVVFGGLYLDKDGVLVNSTVYPPFDSLLWVMHVIGCTNLHLQIIQIILIADNKIYCIIFIVRQCIELLFPLGHTQSTCSIFLIQWLADSDGDP